MADVVCCARPRLPWYCACQLIRGVVCTRNWRIKYKYTIESSNAHMLPSPAVYKTDDLIRTKLALFDELWKSRWHYEINCSDSVHSFPFVYRFLITCIHLEHKVNATVTPLIVAEVFAAGEWHVVRVQYLGTGQITWREIISITTNYWTQRSKSPWTSYHAQIFPSLSNILKSYSAFI